MDQAQRFVIAEALIIPNLTLNWTWHETLLVIQSHCLVKTDTMGAYTTCGPS